MTKVKLSAAFAFLKLKIPSIPELNENNLEPLAILKTIEETKAANPDILIESEVIDEFRFYEKQNKDPCPDCGQHPNQKGPGPPDSR